MALTNINKPSVEYPKKSKFETFMQVADLGLGAAGAISKFKGLQSFNGNKLETAVKKKPGLVGVGDK